MPRTTGEELEDVDHSDDDGTDCSGETSSDTTIKRDRRRLRIIRTGSKGRPRKDYHIQETDMFAEVSIKDAISGPAMDEWYIAMATELRSILKNNVWKLVNRPDDKNIIGSRMILTNKYQSDGCLQKRKARIVAREFSQRPGLDFDETFVPVARLSSI